ILIDAKDKGSVLKQKLADLRKKWVDAGKNLRTEKIHDAEFTILTLSSNDVPKSVRKLIPHSSQVQELGDDNEPKKPAPDPEWTFGQVDSLLIAGTATKSVEKVVAGVTSGTMPALGELAVYQANHLAMFRDAPLYGWANIKIFLDVFTRKASEKKE